MDTAFGNKLICNTAYFADCKSAETQNSLPGQGEEVGSIPTYGTKRHCRSFKREKPWILPGDDGESPSYS